MNRTVLSVLPAALLAALFAAGARAAPSLDACTGAITQLPAVITHQGTWCLEGDEFTNISSGAAILVMNHNVTIDCNGFKLGGQPAGPTSQASGIRAEDKLNVVVRGCNIRGFRVGVDLDNFDGGGGGHVVEDNRIDGGHLYGIRVEGDGSVVRRNRVSDIWSTTVPGIGIIVRENVDVIDNAVSSIDSLAGTDYAIGIYVNGSSAATIRGNRIRGLTSAGGNVFGILQVGDGPLAIRENDVTGESVRSGSRWAVCSDSGAAMLNIAAGFPVVASGCQEAGNVVLP